jgi:hypothetical protein
MRQSFSAWTILSLLFTASANPLPRHHHHPKGATGATGPANTSASNPQAIYFMTNAAQNSIVALRVAADGTLSDGSITSTGGAGMNGINGATGGPAAPDALFSRKYTKFPCCFHSPKLARVQAQLLD